MIATVFLVIEILTGCYLALEREPAPLLALTLPSLPTGDLLPLVGGLAASGVLSALGWLTTRERRCQYC